MIRLALISEGLNTWPVYVAQALGLWRDAGVEVQLTVTGSSIQQLDALKAGGFDVGFQQTDHVVRGVERGADLFVFMAQSHAPELSLIVAADVASVADLKGRDIVVDDARTGYSLLLRKLFAEHGLGENDTHFRDAGGSQERYDAMLRGEGAACLINAPFDRNLVAAGLKSLGTSSEFFPTYPGPIAAARRSWASAHRAELIAFIRGLHRAFAWLRDTANRDEAVRLLPARLNMPADAAARALPRQFGQPLPQITEAGVAQVIALVWAAEKFSPPMAQPSKYLDLSYLRAASADAAA